MLPQVLQEPLREHLIKIKILHDEETEEIISKALNYHMLSQESMPMLEKDGSGNGYFHQEIFPKIPGVE
jgi:hypothetical protein